MSIKNIVFDMGNVLVKYDAMLVCKHFIENEEDCKQVCTSVFVSPEWIMLDMGVITEEKAMLRMKSRLPERLHTAAEQCMKNWDKFNMMPVEEMRTLLESLKKKGYHLYVCSNASMRLLDCYQKVIPAWDIFDGILFSAEIKCMKPQKEMYEQFFERFSLVPEECFFIDDLDINIEGAKACGMEGYCFADGDIQKLSAYLEQLQ